MKLIYTSAPYLNVDVDCHFWKVVVCFHNVTAKYGNHSSHDLIERDGVA